MIRKWVMSGFLLGLIGVVAFVAGCGQSQQAATSAPATTQSVSINGTVAASPSDLSQLGVSTLTVKAAGADVDLTARGFTRQSVNAAHLVPMATSGTVITVGTFDASGALTRVATASVGSDGSYSVDIPDYDTTLTYGAVVTKTDTTRNKTLEMKVVYPAPTGGRIASSDAQVSPQTTLIAQMIIDKVVKVLESAKIDPAVVANVKDAIISAVDTLISSGTITVTTVRDSTATENASLSEASDKAASDTTVSGKLDSIKGALGLAKATDLASAKGAIFELFKTMTGDPRGVPEEIINAFAAAYLSGVTKTTADITDAVNHSLYNSTGAAVTGTLTAAMVAAQIQGMIRAAYADSLPAGTPAGLKSVIEAVFPRSEWLTKTIAADTRFSVPQMFLLMGAGDAIAASVHLSFNAPQAAYRLGLMAGISDKAKIMHSELRIVSFQDWQNFRPTPGGAQEPTPERALASWVDVGNVVTSSARETEGYTCWLTYTNTADATVTKQYALQTSSMGAGLKRQSVKAQEEGKMGPPPGWKNFNIQPWDSSTGVKITDFKANSSKIIKATITVKTAAGVVVDTKEIEIPDINLSNVNIAVNVPKMGWLDHPENLTRFPKDSKPTLNWLLSSIDTTIPDGYRLAYVIQVVKGTVQSGGPGGGVFFNAYYGDPTSRIFDSWEKQDFPDASVGTSETWTLPVTLSSDGFCEFGISVVALNKKTGQPVSEGTHKGGIFIVGTPTAELALIQAAFHDIAIPTLPSATLTTRTLTLEGKVHADLLRDRFSGANVKVGLFQEKYDAAKGYDIVAVTNGGTTVESGLATVEGQTYKSFQLVFPGSVFGTNYGHYVILLWNDLNNNGAFDAGEDFHRSDKGIGHRPDGTWTEAPDGGRPLIDSLSGFNLLYWGARFD